MGGNYVITNDIALSDSFVAIGSSLSEDKCFYGSLDGNGHTISNMKITNGSGLFAGLGTSGKILNLTVTGNVSLAGDAGCCFLANTNKGYIYNCIAKGSIVLAGNGNVGAFVISNYGIIEKCTSELTISISSNDNMGANSSAGIACANSGNIRDCINKGNISSRGLYVAGICAYLSSMGTIESCSNQGDITGTNTPYAGGIVGITSGLIMDCTNSGSLNTSYAQDVTSNTIGGIAAIGAVGSIILNCTNKGELGLAHQVGGIIGNATFGIFDDGGKDEENFWYGKILIADCVNQGRFSSQDEGIINNLSIGGIIGLVRGGRNDSLDKNGLSVLRCINKANIEINSSIENSNNSIGGIIGDSAFSVSAVVEDSSNFGNIVDKSSSSNIAGVVGGLLSPIKISRCVNYGRLEGGSVFGLYYSSDIFGSGLTDVYYANAEISDCANYGALQASGHAAGITGVVKKASNCISTASVKAYKASGVVGMAAEKENLYYNGDLLDNGYPIEYQAIPTRPTIILGTGLSTDQFSSSANLSGLDFSKTWEMGTVDGLRLPVLRKNTPTSSGLLEANATDIYTAKANMTYSKVNITSGKFLALFALDSRYAYMSGNYVIPVSVGTTKIVGITDQGTLVYTTATITESNHSFTIFDFEKYLSWQADGKRCVFTDRCDYCSQMVSIEGKITENINLQSTCTTEGSKRCVADFKINGCDYSGYANIKLEKIAHTGKTKIFKKATLKKDGILATKCSMCSNIFQNPIYKIKKVSLKKTSYKYDGKAKKPKVIVKDSKGNTISSKYYTVKYKNNKKKGTAKAIVSFKTRYSGKVVLKFKIK